MRILSLDTSTELGSVAVLVDGELRAEVAARVRAKHGETVFALMAQALSLSGVSKQEIELLAVGLGPGSFTGTRVGVATAKGLAVALDRPLVGVSSLRAIARAAPAERVTVLVDAHKGEVYGASYVLERGSLRETLAPFHAPPEAARARIPTGVPVIGSGVRRYPTHFGDGALPPLFDVARASFVALEAAERFEAHGPDDRATLEPLYVRDSDATPTEAPA